MRAAAKLLSISHSTVARRLDELEARMGTQLIKRSSNGFTLSESGEDVLAAAMDMRKNMQTLDRKVFGKDRQLEGKLTLALLDAMATPQILNLINEFRRRYPSIDLTLDIREQLSNLDSGEADIAIRFGKTPAEHHVGRHITPTGRAIYISAARLEAQGEQLGDDDGWISYTPPPQDEKWKLLTPYPDLPTNLYVSDMRAQHMACSQGLGIAQLPCFLGDSDDSLVKISDVEFPRFQHLWVVKTVEAKQNARVSALSQFLVDSLQQLTPFLRGESKGVKQLLT